MNLFEYYLITKSFR